MTESDAPVVSLPSLPSPWAMREELQTLVTNDLIGPRDGAEEEFLVPEKGRKERPGERYLLGRLAPRHRQQQPDPVAIEADAMEDDDIVASGPEDGGTALEREADRAAQIHPSSFGLTCCLDGDTKALHITVRWGHYESRKSDTQTSKEGNALTTWHRTQREATIANVRLFEGDFLEHRECTAEQPGVYVQGKARRVRGDWVVTLFLVNGQAEPEQNRDTAWLFQPELSVSAEDESPAFVQRRPPWNPERITQARREEHETAEMLYRHCREFAVGHNIGIHADLAPGDPDRAVRIATRIAPVAIVPATVHPGPADHPGLGALELDMRVLGEEVEPDVLLARLRPLPAAYASWLAEQRARMADTGEGLAVHEAACVRAFAECAEAAERIAAGVELLGTDPEARAAFAFANRAMWRQRIQTLLYERRKEDGTITREEVDVPSNRSWRLFQLAFLLLNLPGLTQLDHPERSTDSTAVADLLWFPTGGGKTEAYLGLTAYTLAIRRLQGAVEGRPGQYGVAVLMRYTLRLLTLQQFQRAAALICACEVLRREALGADDWRWGNEPFRLGLWVGGKSTPNATSDSNEALVQLKQAAGARFRPAGASPAQLTSCPWCGHEIHVGTDIDVDQARQGRGRTIIFCGQTQGHRCPFTRTRSEGEGLPVVVVDEEIYRLLPALVIATVDKFARMPWVAATAMLFGKVTHRCPRHGFVIPDFLQDGARVKDATSHPKTASLPGVKLEEHPLLRPPDLIIQDELHLISGPLGTLVGLYETAVEGLATWTVNGKRVRPKVIASTATIRRAPQQVQALFDRAVSVFPPQGIDLKDNFFSKQQEPSPAYPGRLYFGVCAPGIRLKRVLVRVYDSYLASAQVLFDKYGRHADAWMTLVGYFNAIRELAGMRHLVEDRVRDAVRNAEQRGLANRTVLPPKELTSRISAADIPHLLDDLAVRFAENPAKGERPPGEIDVLLASSMISVGVDVSRLGLMVMAGQPKSAAEYIQASSRVGRSKDAPGIVCTVLNWARPRDLSHYESFEQFHGAFYRHVEALSVTPFAARAIDRGLTAVLVSLLRHHDSLDFNSNTAANQFRSTHPAVAAATEQIRRRAAGFVGDPAGQQHLLEALEERLATWEHLAAQPASVLGYEGSTTVRAFLEQARGGDWTNRTCLNSMRDVEAPVGLLMQDGPLRPREFEFATDAISDAGGEA